MINDVLFTFYSTTLAEYDTKAACDSRELKSHRLNQPLDSRKFH